MDAGRLGAVRWRLALGFVWRQKVVTAAEVSKCICGACGSAGFFSCGAKSEEDFSSQFQRVPRGWTENICPSRCPISSEHIRLDRLKLRLGVKFYRPV